MRKDSVRQAEVYTVRYKAVAGAHRSDGKRLVVRADEKLIAFVELESQLVVKGMDF